MIRIAVMYPLSSSNIDLVLSLWGLPLTIPELSAPHPIPGTSLLSGSFLDWQTFCAAFGLTAIYAVLWAIAFRK